MHFSQLTNPNEVAWLQPAVNVSGSSKKVWQASLYLKHIFLLRQSSFSHCSVFEILEARSGVELDSTDQRHFDTACSCDGRKESKDHPHTLYHNVPGSFQDRIS
jgi:hypothetical protein